MPPLPAPLPSTQFVKLLISIIEKKLDENYVEFYFSISTVLVIFSFFRTGNDLVRAPPPPIVVLPHNNYAHTWRTSQKLLTRFFRNFGKLFQTI